MIAIRWLDTWKKVPSPMQSLHNQLLLPVWTFPRHDQTVPGFSIIPNTGKFLWLHLMGSFYRQQGQKGEVACYGNQYFCAQNNEMHWQTLTVMSIYKPQYSNLLRGVVCFALCVSAVSVFHFRSQVSLQNVLTSSFVHRFVTHLAVTPPVSSSPSPPWRHLVRLGRSIVASSRRGLYRPFYLPHPQLNTGHSFCFSFWGMLFGSRLYRGPLILYFTRTQG